MLGHEAGGKPQSEVTGGPQGGTLDEDGLDDVARDAAEAPVGTKRGV